MTKSSKFHGAARVMLFGIVILFSVAIYFMPSHIRAAKSIKAGYSPTAVHQLLGPPTATIKSIKNLNEMFPPTTSYTFRTLDGGSVKTSTIRFQVADWFEIGTAGYLVIYEDGTVVRTIFGGT